MLTFGCRSSRAPVGAGSDRLDAADAALSRGEVGKVIDLLKGRSQDSTRGSKLLGRAYLASGDYNNARDAFTRAVALDSKDSESWIYLAQASERDRFFERAADAYEHVLTVHPGNAEAARKYAFLLTDLGRFPDALAALRRAAELLPNDEEVRYRIGVVELTRNRNEEAEAAFHFVLQQIASHAPARMGRGLARARLAMNINNPGRRAEMLKSAEEDFNESMKAAADWAEPAYNLGWVHEEIHKNTADAEKAYREALRRNPQHINSMIRVAGLLEKRGEKAEALGFYQKILTLTSDPRVATPVQAQIEELSKKGN
ncbi:MAG: tetratricopeptide repeat protein [Planctomycetota bacterium]